MASTPRKRGGTLGTSQIVMATTKAGAGRMSMGASLGGGGIQARRSNIMRSSVVGPEYTKGAMTAQSKQTVSNVINEKAKEKEELGGLNLKLAEYIECQHYHQSKINMLTEAIEKWKKEKCPNIEDLKSIYEEELDAYRQANKELKDSISEYEPKIMRLQNDLDSKTQENELLKKQMRDLDNKLKALASQMSDLDSEVCGLRSEVETLSMTNAHKTQEIDRLNDVIFALSADLEHAREEQMQYHNLLEQERAEFDLDRDAMAKQIELLSTEVEMLKRCQPDVKKTFTHGFKKAVSDVKESMEDAMNAKINLLSSQYESKIQQLKNAAAAPRKVDNTDSVTVRENRELKSKMTGTAGEINRLKQQLAEATDRNAELEDRINEQELHCEDEKCRLGATIEDLREDLQESVDNVRELEISQVNLKAEIMTYCKLLEGEAGLGSVLQRSGNVQSESAGMMANLISSSGSGGGSASQTSSVSKPNTKAPSKDQPPQKKQPKTAVSQSHGQVRLQKKTKGNCAFTEVRADGQFAEISNEGSTDMDLSEWCIVRTSGSGSKVKRLTFEFPKSTTLQAKRKFRIYSQDNDEEAAAENKKGTFFVARQNWGAGNCEFTLLNHQQKEQASAKMTFT